MEPSVGTHKGITLGTSVSRMSGRLLWAMMVVPMLVQQGLGKPSYSQKHHLNKCERKDQPLAALQCSSQRATAVVSKEPGNRQRETGGENI